MRFAKIKPAVFASSQERGVAATFDIGSSECICSVPAKAALRIYPGRSPALGVAADVWQQLPWYAQLALVLLSEIKQARSSKFSDYLALLPDQVDVPALWSEAELNQLKCGYFIEQLLWALSVTRSRAFAAPYAAAPLSVAPKAFAAAQVLAAAAWLAAGPAAAAGVQLLGAAAAGGAWFALQQQLQTQQQHAICPLLDFFNHDGREQSECELDVWSNAFRVVSTRQWRQGQQVSISYGQSSSDVLLQLYGFVEPGNIHESVLTQQGLPVSAETAAMLAEEVQLLGDQQALADDLAVLQAVQQLPVKQQALQVLQAQLQKRQVDLQQLQEHHELWQQQQQQQQQQQDKAAQHPAAGSDTNAWVMAVMDLQQWETISRKRARG
ncbi:hypothetical protein COO60DRAFT_1646404 [Scenedesmus sp. NREL 46B-D3]|nr:hypothetical protein COO60DRAFT_1646404 [Scenedesmus sp. NREL 46B-D3]